MTEVTDAGLKLLRGAAIHTRRGAGGLNQALFAVLLAVFWRMDLSQKHFLQMLRASTALLGSERMMETNSPLCCPLSSPCAAPLLCCGRAAGVGVHQGSPASG